MKYLTLKISALSIVCMLIFFSCENKEKITLQYNFQQGDMLKQNMVLNMDLVQNYMENELKVSIVIGMNMTFEVKESRDDLYTLEVKFKELKVKMGIPGMDIGTISLDSNTTEDAGIEMNFGTVFKAIIDRPFEVVMDKIGKVKSVKGLESFSEIMLNAFDDDVPETLRRQVVELFGSQFSDEAIKAQLEQSMGYFPNKPVGIGNSWNVKMQSNVSNFAININVKSTLKSVEDNVVTLNIDGTVTTPEGYEQEVNGVKTKLALKGVQKGVLKINKDTGWVISSDIMINFDGKMDAVGVKIPFYVATKATVTDQ
ncbi:MAG: DUF6263 family protein [Prevotellaceae bacterium]|jgi:hypothetical protein|nr:DUF6263 family protein [Prevotellaceae bacterium]